MADLVDLYKNLEGNILFHAKLKKLKYHEGKVYLNTTPLVNKFILTGDIVNLRYMSFMLPGRVVGKNNHIIVNVFYAGEGRLGERSKPRVLVQKEYSFAILLKIENVFRSFSPIDISEGGFSISLSNSAIVSKFMNEELDFKIMGREELLGVSGTARLVGIMEEGPNSLKLAFEIDVDDASSTKIRLYVINTIKRLLSGT